jgi:hypothetical protein
VAIRRKGGGMTPEKLALLFYMAGSLAFLAGSLVLWFK